MTTQCPKSLITAESLRLLELYRVWKRLGKGCTMSLEAKSVEAIELLEDEWIAENERENQ